MPVNVFFSAVRATIPGVESLTALLERALPALSRDSGAPTLARLRLAWPAVVGSTLAGLTDPIGFDARTSLVDVAVEAPWREALFQLRHVAIDRMRAVAPVVRGWRLVTVPTGTLPRAPLRSADISATPSPAAPEPGSEGVGDPALRGALDGLLAAWRDNRDARDETHRAPEAKPAQGTS